MYVIYKQVYCNHRVQPISALRTAPTEQVKNKIKIMQGCSTGVFYKVYTYKQNYAVGGGKGTCALDVHFKETPNGS